MFKINTIYAIISGLVRLSRRSRFLLKLPNLSSGRRLIVMGNGPSLSSYFDQLASGIENADLLCVNHFPSTDKYSVLQPRYCMFADSAFWDERVSQTIKAAREADFAAIEKHARKETFLLFPIAAKTSIEKQLSWMKNPNLSKIYYNSVVLPDAMPTPLRMFLYRRNLAIAGLQTVLNGAISIGISLGYKRINLIGAESSFLEDIFIDDKTNLLNEHLRHFYRNDKPSTSVIFSDLQQTTPMKLHEFLRCLQLMFEGYHECARYAEDQGCSIINSTGHSWIDAFKRGPIE